MEIGQIEVKIRERAYALWEQEGRPDGREWDHWVRAAGEVVTVAAKPAAKPAGKALAKAKARKTKSA